MPLGPMDDFLAHQTPDTFDHVYTGDRAFYDRYYFNCHSSSDEIFLITGILGDLKIGLCRSRVAAVRILVPSLVLILSDELSSLNWIKFKFLFYDFFKPWHKL